MQGFVSSYSKKGLKNLHFFGKSKGKSLYGK